MFMFTCYHLPNHNHTATYPPNNSNTRLRVV